MTVEVVLATTKNLRNVSEVMSKVLASDASSESKLSAILVSITTSVAADLLERFERRDLEMRSAIEAALVSLEAIPDAKHVAAVLSAAIVEEGR